MYYYYKTLNCLGNCACVWWPRALFLCACLTADRLWTLKTRKSTFLQFWEPREDRSDQNCLFSRNCCSICADGLQGERIVLSVHPAALDVANHQVLIVILLSIKYSRTKCFLLVNTTLVFSARFLPYIRKSAVWSYPRVLAGISVSTFPESSVILI